MQFQLNSLFKTINKGFWPQPGSRLGDLEEAQSNIPDQVDSDQVFHVRQQSLGGRTKPNVAMS